LKQLSIVVRAAWDEDARVATCNDVEGLAVEAETLTELNGIASGLPEIPVRDA
jgi:hypothetical protein